MSEEAVRLSPAAYRASPRGLSRYVGPPGVALREAASCRFGDGPVRSSS